MTYIPMEELDNIRSISWKDKDAVKQVMDKYGVTEKTVELIIKGFSRPLQNSTFGSIKDIHQVFIETYKLLTNEIPESKIRKTKDYVLITVPKNKEFYQIQYAYLKDKDGFIKFINSNLKYFRRPDKN